MDVYVYGEAATKVANMNMATTMVMHTLIAANTISATIKAQARVRKGPPMFRKQVPHVFRNFVVVVG